MNKKQYTWETDESEEIWRHDKFDTIEECVADYLENYTDGNPQESIFVGEVEQFAIDVDGVQLIERIEEAAYEDCGECAEDWEPSTGKTVLDWADLDEQLTKVVVDWLTKHNDMPNFYKVVDIREVETDE